MPWSSWTTWSPVRSSAKDWSARPAGAARPRRAAAEHLRVGQQREPEVAPDEAAARRADGEQELRLVRELRALVDQAASTRRTRFWVLSASPWCGKATTVRRPPRTKARSSFSASASPRAAIAGCCASNENGWPAGSGSSSTAPSDRRPSAPPRSQTSRTSLGCQTKSGPAGTGETRSVGTGSEPRRLVVGERRTRRGRARRSAAG